jgi:S1-C subfamily serine protease
LLVNVVQLGSNAATHGIKVGDVMLSYNGAPLYDPYDVNPVTDSGRPVSIKVWRDGRVIQHELAPGTLGVRIERSIDEPRCALRWCTTDARKR